MTLSDAELLKSVDAGASASRICAYLDWLRRQGMREFETYDDLWNWSVTDLDGFWRSVWDFFDIDSLDSAAGSVNSPAITNKGMPGTQWFPDRTLNYAEVVLRIPGRADDDIVLLAESQSRPTVAYTARELRDAVGRARAGLIRLGIGRGDRVAAYAPNVPEVIILMLAATSIGAIFSSCPPEFEVQAVIDRWQQIQPHVVLAADGYRYGNRQIDRTEVVAAFCAQLSSVHTVVWLPLIAAHQLPTGDLTWSELIEHTGELSWEPMGFLDPLYILYSSGTTGPPKAITHGHGGISLEHLKTLALHFDLGPADRFFWFTTTGWMMWNVLVSGLAVGSTIVLFDGDPKSPDLTELWRVAEREAITFFGASASFLSQCSKSGIAPRDGQNLVGLRSVGSTGSPLSEEGYRWVYRELGNVQLVSFAGGTDICSGFLGGSPLHAVHAGQIACRHLGCRVEAFDETGRSILDDVGELVVTTPMPSMPVGFWGDADDTRLRESYFNTYPGVWRHGDWITIGSNGRCVISGRSDATLNRGGVRLGTAEFYTVVEALDSVADTLVVHLDHGVDVLVLFVVPTEPNADIEDLRRQITGRLRTVLSPRHIPDFIIPVTDLPRTLSGKKVEVPIKKILHGTAMENAIEPASLANPDALQALIDGVPDSLRAVVGHDSRCGGP